MSSAGHMLQRLGERLALRRYRARERLARLALAWRYFMGRLSPDDAQRLTLDCEDRAGWHPLLVLTVEDALEHAREFLADHFDLPRLIAAGCARAGRKWDSSGDELHVARQWAMDVAEDYAADEGIALVRLDDEAILRTEDAP